MLNDHRLDILYQHGISQRPNGIQRILTYAHPVAFRTLLGQGGKIGRQLMYGHPFADNLLVLRYASFPFRSGSILYIATVLPHYSHPFRITMRKMPGAQTMKMAERVEYWTLSGHTLAEFFRGIVTSEPHSVQFLGQQQNVLRSYTY